MLPKKFRLKEKKDFQEVIQKGKRLEQEFLILKVLENKLKMTRIGFVVGKRVSKKAVCRHKARRRLSEVVKSNLPLIKTGYDLIFFGKKGLSNKDFREIKKTIQEFLKKARILKNDD